MAVAEVTGVIRTTGRVGEGEGEEGVEDWTASQSLSHSLHQDSLRQNVVPEISQRY